jgi:hypothetical protein
MNQTFRYRAKPATMILAGGFFALCGSFLAHKAANNDRGLIINGIIELGVTGGTVFFTVLAVFSALFVIAAAAGTIDGLVRAPVLALADDHIVVPGTLFRRAPRRIDFAAVTKASLQSVNRQAFLTLETARGKVSVARSMLESQATFDYIVDFVTSRITRPA